MNPRCLRAVVLVTFASFAAALQATGGAGERAVAAERDTAFEVAAMAKIRRCSSPSFSPDGQQIAFVSDITGVPQVWTMPATGGWPTLVTDLEDQVGSVAWSPRGDWLAFMVAPGGGLNQQIYLVRPDGRQLHRITSGGRSNNWLSRWSREGRFLAYASNLRQPQSLDVYLYDVEAGTSTRLVENPGIGLLTDLSRDGKRAVLYRLVSRGDNDLFLLDRGNGEEHRLTPHEGPGNFGGGELSPDGSRVYLSSDAGRDRVAFARLDLDEGGVPGPTVVLAGRDDAELESFTVTEDGRLAALLWNVAGRDRLELFDLESERALPTPELPGDLAGGLVFSADGSKLALVVSGAGQPSDIWVLSRATPAAGWAAGRFDQLTRSPHAGVDLASLVRPELVRYRAHDGLELSGWLYRPPGVEGPAPYVLSFHGGPEGQERPRFRGDYQALLGRGIGVFAPNVRGSSGFGKRFVNLDNGALRFDGIRDIESSVRFLVEQGLGDAKRLGIMGGSYGGYMTMAGLTEYPGLFAAGANLYGVVNFETFFAQTEPWMAAISTVEYGDPVREKGLLRRLSPIHKVEAVKAPTLVLHGANDTNVPVVEAEQVVESLKRRQIPVRYILFPDEGHGFRKTSNRITSTVEVVEWFERYLRPALDEPAAP